MRVLPKILLVFTIIFLSSCTPQSPPTPVENIPTKKTEPVPTVYLPTMTPLPLPEVASTAIQTPPKGFLYHGVFPGGRTGEEDDIKPIDLSSYEQTVGKDAAWVYFSNNWFHSRDFPAETAEWIRDAGSIPYIRLMLRPALKYAGEDTIYSPQNIIDGHFDDDLSAWCENARAFGTNLIVEYGTEVNSDSFVWSGIYNGGGRMDGYGDISHPDGPERFQDAYRQIIQICREKGATNITWVFHMDSANHPDEPWNRAKNYYPGDEWIDWIGVSIYGAHEPNSLYIGIFSNLMDLSYAHIAGFAPDKPVIITEFGTTKNNIALDQIQWTKDAFMSMDTKRYPNLIGFSWWNERWQNDGNPNNDTTMRVEDNPDLAELFREFVGNNSSILGSIEQ